MIQAEFMGSPKLRPPSKSFPEMTEKRSAVHNIFHLNLQRLRALCTPWRDTHSTSGEAGCPMEPLQGSVVLSTSNGVKTEAAKGPSEDSSVLKGQQV